MVQDAVAAGEIELGVAEGSAMTSPRRAERLRAPTRGPPRDTRLEHPPRRPRRRAGERKRERAGPQPASSAASLPVNGRAASARGPRGRRRALPAAPVSVRRSRFTRQRTRELQRLLARRDGPRCPLLVDDARIRPIRARLGRARRRGPGPLGSARRAASRLQRAPAHRRRRARRVPRARCRGGSGGSRAVKDPRPPARAASRSSA